MADARDAILSASARCIARTGVRGLRVLDVAKEAGVSSGLLYYHFDDRDGLLAATLDHINASALGYRARERAEASPTERVIAMLIDEIADDDDVRDQSAAWNEIRAAAVFEPALAASLARVTKTWEADVAAAVREAQSTDGVAASADPDELAATLTTLVEGVSARWLTGHIDADRARAVLRSAAEQMLHP